MKGVKIAVVCLCFFHYRPTNARSQKDETASRIRQNDMARHVRLVNGPSAAAGRLEVRQSGRWGTVCDDKFEDSAATVVCQSLGFARGVERPRAFYGRGVGRIWLDEVECTGAEASLFDCSNDGWGASDCTHEEDVGVECFTEEPSSLRLTGTSSSSSGRLEVLHAGEWGTVCDRAFDEDDVRVVCGTLGFPTGYISTYDEEYYTTPSHVWLSDVDCTGQEADLTECRHGPWGSNDCQHYQDVWLQCAFEVEGLVRLLDGPLISAGRLYVFHEGVWGTVCDENFGKDEADVVCYSLGYSYGFAQRGTQYGDGSGPVWLDEVSCTGLESSLTECDVGLWDTNTCSHRDDVSIECY